MGALSSGFMTSPDDAIWLSGVDQGLSRMDVSQVLSAILLKDTEFLGHIGFGSAKPASNIEIRWIDDALNAREFTAAHTYAGDAGDDLVISAPSAVDDILKVLRVGTLIQPENTNFIYQVDSQSITTSTITITAYGNKGKGSSVSSTVWKVIGKPFKEGDDKSADISKARNLRKNWTQIFETGIDITKTRRNIDMQAVKDELAHQTKLRMMELKTELNRAALLSYAYYTGGAYTGDDLRRSMKGLKQQIEDYGNTDTFKDASAATLDIGLIDTLTKAMYDLGGLSEAGSAALLVGSQQQSVISSFTEDIIRTDQSNKKAGVYVKKILTKLGVELEVILDRDMPSDSISVIDSSRISLRHLKNDQFTLEKMAKTGRTDSWQLSGQYSIEIRNAGIAHGWVYGLATS